MTHKQELIERLYQGLCSREELEALLDLIRQDGNASGEEDTVLQKLWEELGVAPEVEEPLATRLVNRSLASIEKQENETSRPENPKHPGAQIILLRRRRSFQRYAIAASLLVLIGLATWLWRGVDHSLQYHTAFGEQRSVELPDGSLVKLNANSSLSFSDSWNDTEDRKVWLSGEAYFEVKKNQQTGQKFQVITPDLTVEVLGTVFNVNTRKGSTEVFLEEGQVNIDLPEQENILMTPGELVTYSATTKESYKKKVVAEAPASWKDGTAQFRATPLREIIGTMEEIYGVETVVENASLLDRKFNLGIPVDNLETAYQVLKELTGLDIERDGNRLMIK